MVCLTSEQILITTLNPYQLVTLHLIWLSDATISLALRYGVRPMCKHYCDMEATVLSDHCHHSDTNTGSHKTSHPLSPGRSVLFT